MSLVIRACLPADMPAVRECIVELQEFERRIDERLRSGESIASDYLNDMLARCRERAGCILVADNEGTVAGFVAILTRVPFAALDEPPGEYALVSDLVVRDAFRRRGLGRALLQAAERYARNAGATELRIGVLSGNDSAARLYESLGFAPYLVTMAKRLDPLRLEETRSLAADEGDPLRAGPPPSNHRD